MTTMKRTMPLAARLGAVGTIFSTKGGRGAGAVQPNLRRSRPLADLDDWILSDIGLERQDVMSAEARRTLMRLSAGTLW